MRIVLSIDGSTEMYDYVHVGYLLMALLVAWRTIASFITSAVESDPQYRLASKRSNAKVVETGSWSNIYEIIT